MTSVNCSTKVQWPLMSTRFGSVPLLPQAIPAAARIGIRKRCGRGGKQGVMGAGSGPVYDKVYSGPVNRGTIGPAPFRFDAAWLERQPHHQVECVVVRGIAAAAVIVRARAVELAVGDVLRLESRVEPRHELKLRDDAAAVRAPRGTPAVQDGVGVAAGVEVPQGAAEPCGRERRRIRP